MAYRSVRETTVARCTYCKNEIEKEVYELKRSREPFCSLRCQAAHRSVMGTTRSKCAHCGGPVVRVNKELRKSKSGLVFCNHTCAASFHNQLRRKSRRSKIEIEFFDRLRAAFPDVKMIPNDKLLLDGFEVDIAIPGLSLAIEWNGIVHIQPIYGQERFAKILERDHEKNCRAVEAGVLLVTIMDPTSTKDVVDEALISVSNIIRDLLENMAGPTGIEPATSWLTARHSGH